MALALQIRCRTFRAQDDLDKKMVVGEGSRHGVEKEVRK